MNRRSVSYFVRLRRQREISLFNAFKKLYREQGDKVSEQYSMNGINGAISAINNGEIGVQLLLGKFYREIIGTLAQAQYKKMVLSKKAEGIPDKDRFVMFSQSWIADKILEESTLITGTSVKIVENVIQEGIELGLGEKPIAKNIKDSFRGSISTARSRTIARTETGNAASYAQELGAEETGLQFKKFWIPVDDGATRQGHIGVDPVGMNEDFFVNGAFMKRPNDPRGGAKNVINCRCVCGYEPII